MVLAIEPQVTHKTQPKESRKVAVHTMQQTAQLV